MYGPEWILTPCAVKVPSLLDTNVGVEPHPKLTSGVTAVGARRLAPSWLALAETGATRAACAVAVEAAAASAVPPPAMAEGAVCAWAGAAANAPRLRATAVAALAATRRIVNEMVIVIIPP